MSFLSKLRLTDFRSYERADISGLESGVIVLCGANGAGKTNVLEAVSLLAPGRGLRRAKIDEVARQGGRGTWSVWSQMDAGGGVLNKIGTGLSGTSAKRVIRINGENARSQAALADYMACLWLTPQMDRMFLDGASERRRFLDRMIFSFDPAHAGRVSRYENVLRQRSRLLQDGKDDRAWLEALEAQMVEAGVAIAASRLDFVVALREAALGFAVPEFPKADIAVQGVVEGWLLEGHTALQVEDMLRAHLVQSRSVDMRTGGASIGPHKSDLRVVYADKAMPAAQCSTGEQKALLITIVLAHSAMIAAMRGAPPVLLLDEIAAHLDEGRRGVLYDILCDMGGQVWLTGTDAALFEALEGRAQMYGVADGGVVASSG